MVPWNYSLCWCGKDNGGAKKKQIQQSIANSMNIAKVKIHQNGKQVMNKIHHFEVQFHRAYDWANRETGASFEATDTGTFKDSIHRICPYYFDLLEVFGDHAPAKPKVMSTENLDSLEEEKSEFNNDDDMNDKENGEQEMDNEVNETCFADDMSSIVTGVTSDDSHKKRHNSSISSSIKKKPHMISLVNDAQSAATTAYAQPNHVLQKSKLAPFNKENK